MKETIFGKNYIYRNFFRIENIRIEREEKTDKTIIAIPNKR